MDLFEEALTENSAELLGVLTSQAGFTVTEAEAFLREAAPIVEEHLRQVPRHRSGAKVVQQEHMFPVSRTEPILWFHVPAPMLT